SDSREQTTVTRRRSPSRVGSTCRPRTRSNCFELARTPAAVIEEIHAPATGQTDDQIACTLNSRRYRSGTGKSFTASRVRYIRFAYGIESYCQHLSNECVHGSVLRPVPVSRRRSGASTCACDHALTSSDLSTLEESL